MEHQSQVFWLFWSLVCTFSTVSASSHFATPHTSHLTPPTSHLTGQHYLAEAVTNNAIFCAKERIGAEYMTPPPALCFCNNLNMYAAAAFEKIFGKGLFV